MITTNLQFLFCIFVTCTGTPLKRPTFESQWYRMTSNPGGLNRVDINHGLGEMPVFVQVQVKSIHEPNKDFMFPPTGHILRDDDDLTPFSGMVYLYNEDNVTISAPTGMFSYRGRAIYTETSNFWQGPNSQSSYVADVRVRVWKATSFPKPDFHVSGLPIGAKCDYNQDIVCFYELKHGFENYPGFVVVRTKLKGENKTFSGFMADAVGASHMVFQMPWNRWRRNSYVIYGFNKTVVRVWTDSSDRGLLLEGDAYEFFSVFTTGELEVIAWRTPSFQQDHEHHVDLTSIPGNLFEMETTFQLSTRPLTDSIVANAWVEALDGDNVGFRFPGSGSMAYETRQTADLCSYGGLVYAYTNNTLRIWRPGRVSHGSLICIAKIFAGGLFTQASDNGTVIMKVWTVSDIGRDCSDSDECTVQNSVCIKNKCECEDGYFESQARCKKELTCQDDVPNISNLEQRQRNYIVERGQGTDSFVDDSYLEESWYTVENSEGQYLMPDSSTPPVEGSCGSLKAAFITGFHPVIQDLTVNKTEVAIQVLNSSSIPLSIKIRKCTNSIQYRLQPVVRDSFSFCFDGPSIQGIEDFEDAPEDINLGDLYVDHDLLFEKKRNEEGTETYAPYLLFMCKTDNDTLPTTVLYLTYWFIDNNLLATYGPSSDIANISEGVLLSRGISLGFKISCGLQMTKSITGYKTKLQKSENFFAGIKFTTTLISLPKGGTAELEFTTTVPIGCLYTGPMLPSCSKSLYLKSEDNNACGNSNMMIVNKGNTCGVSMKALKENEMWNINTYAFNITTEDVNYNDRSFFRLQFITDSHQHHIWRLYQPEVVSINVISTDTTKYALCYCHVDPHMRTGDKYLYELQYGGEFILYRNFVYGIEVQMRTTICNRGFAFCACAVAVRAGGDVFLVNLCGKSKLIKFTSCEDREILQVKKITEKFYKSVEVPDMDAFCSFYTVYTPIGTVIDIKLRPHPSYHNLMNIDVYLAPKDVNATEGLCGYYDNRITNDLKKRNTMNFYTIKTDIFRHYHQDFSDEWRIQSNETNYLHPTISSPPKWEHNLFCTCDFEATRLENPESKCSPSMKPKCPRKGTAVRRNCLDNRSEFTIERQRRSLKNFENKRQSSPKEIRRKKREISEQEAEKICRTSIINHSTIEQFKHRLIGFDIEGAIQECVFDVQEEEDESWAGVYPEMMIEIIDVFNEKEPTYVEEHAEEVLQFKQMACPMNCSGHGICNQTGHCNCEEGFRASDCSIDITKPLYIDDIYGDGLCDQSENNTCECFTVQTIDLIEGFQCKISEWKVLLNGTGVFDEVTAHGDYNDIFNGVCCLDKAGRNTFKAADVFSKYYNISISNDGQTFGKHRTMIVYNFDCQEIIDNKVVLKIKTCFIDGNCAQENQTAIFDTCLICLPNNDTFDWTNNCEQNDSFPLLWILIISGGSVAVLILICTVCLCRLRNKK